MGITSALLHESVCQDLQSVTPNDGSVFLASQRLKECLLKKWEGSRNEHTRKAAIDGFMERHTAPPVEVLPSLAYAAGYCQSVLGDICYQELADGLRTGPGSCIGMERGSTSCFTKLAHSKSAVSSLDLYKDYLLLTSEYCPMLYSAEILRRRHYGYPTFAPYSKLITVPKNDAIDRVIAVEPAINAIMQQGVSHCITNRLKAAGIDLSTQQDRNRAFARRGSLGHGFATVDFSAASDHISDLLVRRLFGASWSFLLESVSTGAVLCEEHVIKGNIRYSMGNATTFPLQTLLFLSLVREVYQELGIPFRVNINVAVFGDDVILVDEAAARFMELSVECGLLPNKEKSFFTGDFRESCGSDWVRGVNIRSVYIKRLDDVSSLFTARNLLMAWSHRWCVSLDLTLDLIDKELCGKGHFVPVPMHAPLNSGVRCLYPKDAIRDSNGSIRYQSFRCVAKGRDARLYFTVHPAFLLQGYLGGGLKTIHRRRKNCVTTRLEVQERQEKVRYGRVNNVTPHWGHIDPSDFWLYDVACTTSGAITFF